MSNRIFPTIAPFIRAIFGQDDNDDFRVARVDYNGGLLAGPFGAYNSIWNEQVITIFPSSGDQTIRTTAVPSGYLYVLQTVACMHSDSTARIGSIRKDSGGVSYHIISNRALAQYVILGFQANLVLAPGDQMNFTVESIAANQALMMWVCGYKVRLT